MKEQRAAERAEVVVIGAGLAGAACAWQLTRAGVRDLLIVEREATPGVHATSQNAAMVRQHAANPFTAGLARRGAAFYADPPDALAPLAFNRCGSVLIGGQTGELGAGFIPARDQRLSADELGTLLGGQRPASGRWRTQLTPSDGVADPHGLLSALLASVRAAGGRVRCGVSARLGDEGELWLRDGDGERLVRCEAVMAAPGAWARELLPLPAQPLRRHLFVSEDDGGLPSVPSSLHLSDWSALIYYMGDIYSEVGGLAGNGIRVARRWADDDFASPWITSNILPSNQLDPMPVYLEGGGVRLYHTSTLQPPDQPEAHLGPAPGYTDSADAANFDPPQRIIGGSGNCLDPSGGECLLDPAFLRLDDGTLVLYFTWLDGVGSGDWSLGIGRAFATD